MATTENRQPEASLTRTLIKAVKDAALIGSVTAVVALLINLVHPERIPYIAEEAYEILVPCPEPGGEVSAIEAAALSSEKHRFFIDARDKAAFDRGHFPGAVHVPYDYLDPTPKEVLTRLAKDVARSKAQKVIVYGDGAAPDTGEQLGKEISGYGIKNVHFVKGGAPAMQKEKRLGETP